MHRTFATSTTRQQTYLDGAWGFVIDPEDVGIPDGWYRKLPGAEVRLRVPGVWNTHPDYLNYEGVAWYRTSFCLGECAGAVIHFAAVTHQANVWLDGEPLGEHYGGYLPFSFLLSEPEPGQHDLVVRVDNTHDMVSTIPSANLDWFRYGGIPRPVWVEELQGPGYVASLRLVPVLRRGKPILQLRSEIANLTDSPLDGQWTLHVDDEPARSNQAHLDPGETLVLRFALGLEDARLWSPEDPHLYSVRLAFAGDDLIERTGFREIRVAGPQVFLNGEPLRLRGVNRHEDHPDWGPALPQHIMLRDLELLRHLGANAIRGCRYPNDQRMLDLCDEQGILFMAETPLWGFRREQLAQDIISTRASAMVWGMVARDANHPCIWAWSVLNECATDVPEGRVLVEQLVETVREIDSTRPVTYASLEQVNDICYDLVDVVCVNAPCGGDPHDLPTYLDSLRGKIGNKPLIVSEFGAGPIHGCRSQEEGDACDGEYQGEALATRLSHLIKHEDTVGFYIWQLFDTRSDDRDPARRSHRNMGLLDDYRRPKPAYYALRDLLTERHGH